MLDGCKMDEYYSAAEVAGKLGLTRQAVIDRCKKNKFQGAIKTEADKANRQGLWLIPRHIIDNPTTPAALTQSDSDTTEDENITAFILRTVTAATEPLVKKIDMQSVEIYELKQQLQHLSRQQQMLKISKSENGKHTSQFQLDFWVICTTLIAFLVFLQFTGILSAFKFFKI